MDRFVMDDCFGARSLSLDTVHGFWIRHMEKRIRIPFRPYVPKRICCSMWLIQDAYECIQSNQKLGFRKLHAETLVPLFQTSILQNKYRGTYSSIILSAQLNTEDIICFLSKQKNRGFLCRKKVLVSRDLVHVSHKYRAYLFSQSPSPKRDCSSADQRIILYFHFPKKKKGRKRNK